MASQMKELTQHKSLLGPTQESVTESQPVSPEAEHRVRRKGHCCILGQEKGPICPHWGSQLTLQGERPKFIRQSCFYSGLFLFMAK